jgi:hypothetical protein
MAIEKKEVKDFDLEGNPLNSAQLLMQTAGGVTKKTTKGSLLNEVSTSILSLQNQIDNLDLDYVSEVELNNISGLLQAQITSNDIDILNLQSITTTISGDLNNLQQQFNDLDLTYATDINLANISGLLQSQITSNDIDILGLVGISANHEARILALEDISDLDAKYVDVTGDTMTGNLSISGAKLVLTDLITTEENVLQVDSDGCVISSELQELYVPVENIVDSDSEGEKGQWSYAQGYFYRCIATDTWVKHPIITDVTTDLLEVGSLSISSLSGSNDNFLTVDNTGLLIDSGVSVTSFNNIQTQTQTISGDLNVLQQQFNDLDFTYATDINLSNISGILQAQITSNTNNVSSLISISGNHEQRLLDLEDISDLDANYVNVTGDVMTGDLSISGANLVMPGLVTTEENVAQVDNSGNLITTELQELYIPIEEITDENSVGIKGQWSFSNGYKYECVATNTWIRFVVATSFTV